MAFFLRSLLAWEDTFLISSLKAVCAASKAVLGLCPLPPLPLAVI